MPNIKQAIIQWDRKSTDDIETIYNSYSDKANFITQLLKCYKQPTLDIGASWLLKQHLQHGFTLNSKQNEVILKQLPALSHWETKLHILQSLSFLLIAEPQKMTLESFLRQCLVSSNKFVRAWAYDGFYQLAHQYPEYKTELKIFFNMAMKDEAPSVKARIRNILRKGF